MNEESRRGLEEYRRQRQFDRGGNQICVVFLACDPTLAECIVDQIPPGRLATASFASLEALLGGQKSKLVAGDHCLVIDGTTDQIDGLSVFSEIAKRQWTLPVVALVRHGDVHSAVHFMRAGACDVIEKTSAARDLPTSIRRALSGASTRVPASRPGYPLLSGEERRLLQLTVGGALTKQIAREMGISLRTVQLRRSALRKKLGARTAAELIRLALRAGLCQ
jgi:FixJ family two-component response regulator